MYRQLFFSGTSFLAEALRGPLRVKEELHTPPSFLWVCSACGETYQRAPVVDSAGRISRWRALHGTCSRCAPTSRSLYDWPGTFYLPLQDEYNAALPAAVLLHDFHTHHSHFKRFFP